MKIIKTCEKAGLCREIATHVLVYIDKSNFKEITDKPKFYCRHHAHYMQLATNSAHTIQSRIYTVDQWSRRVEAWELENKQMLKERWKDYY